MRRGSDRLLTVLLRDPVLTQQVREVDATNRLRQLAVVALGQETDRGTSNAAELAVDAFEAHLVVGDGI